MPEGECHATPRVVASCNVVGEVVLLSLMDQAPGAAIGLPTYVIRNCGLLSLLVAGLAIHAGRSETIDSREEFTMASRTGA